VTDRRPASGTATPPPITGDAQFGLMTEIARRYHLEGETQDAIARALDLSRMKVNRLLREAQAAGLVEIRVRFHSSQTGEIERALCDRFGLKHLLVAPTAGGAEQQRRNVAMSVAHFLESNLRENQIVAVGMGRNVAAVAEMQAARSFQKLTFVSGSGGAAEAGSEGNADHICRKLARRLGGIALTLYAPAFVPETRLREGLMRNGTVRRTLNLARSADFALVGIGDLGPDSHMARMGWFSRDELRTAQEAGVVGDMMGYDFHDLAGRPCNDTLGGRVIGLSREDLTRIPTTIAVAAEPGKSRAILGALRTGAIDVLATSLQNCLAIREMLERGD
jgi:DNA-binding transcriptional regulator LsrR (DeoR family)